MKFDPIKKEIYTDEGKYIKQMNCRYKINWDNLEKINPALRKCGNCNHLIIDTAFLSDEELYNIVRQDPDACLKIDLNQDNIKIISNGFREQK